MSNGNAPAGLQHIFVLVMENRAFDHLLGFSKIRGTDAETGAPTQINGLTGSESNQFNGVSYTVNQPAPYIMPADPGHEFPNVLHQLCGPDATYTPKSPYPPILNSGFVASYVQSGGAAAPGEVMKCYSPSQLPVLTALAQEFVVCDNWHAPLPGPTWPNRAFVHAASSAGLDHSPTTEEIVQWELADGLSFPNGTIFDALKRKGISRRLYAGDHFPMVAALKGVGLGDIREYDEHFAADLQQPSYPYSYIFIEPSYDTENHYRNGTSMHPLGDVRNGEKLIKSTYEALRNSAYWDSSLLIITWDEHGGFFDHAIPPAAVAPGDTQPESALNQLGFTFEQYGPRVPALIISPLIPKNRIDHRLYDHSSMPATLERWLELSPMTKRDAAAANLLSLMSLATPRTDTPPTLPDPFTAAPPAAATPHASPAPAVPDEVAPIQGNLPAILHSALRQDLEASPPEQRYSILERVASLKTRADAVQYLEEVKAKVHGSGAAAGSGGPR